MTTTSPRRNVLLAVLGSNRNGWMASFGYASHHIAAAIADGRITDDLLAGFAAYDGGSCRAIAHAAGLPFDGDVDPIPAPLAQSYGGALSSVSDEDVTISVEAIVGLAAKPLEIDGGIIYLYEDETGVECVPGATLAEVNAVRPTNVRDAAQAFLDADAYFSVNGGEIV
jgi:hypothetical protein